MMTAVRYAALAGGLLACAAPACAQNEPLFVPGDFIGTEAPAKPGAGPCRIAFRSPAQTAAPDLMRVAKKELVLEVAASPDGSLEAHLAGSMLATSIYSRIKLGFESGPPPVESGLGFAGLSRVRIKDFGFVDAAMFMARVESSAVMYLVSGVETHGFDLWEAPAAMARFKACIRMNLRGQPAESSPAPLRAVGAPRPAVIDGSRGRPTVPGYSAPGVKGAHRSGGNDESCELTFRNPSGFTPLGLGVAVDQRGQLIVALKNAWDTTPSDGPYLTSLDGKSITSGVGGFVGGGLRISNGEEAAKALRLLENGGVLRIDVVREKRSDVVEIAPWGAARTWLVDCVARRFGYAGSMRSFLDGEPMVADAARLGAAWFRAAGVRSLSFEGLASGFDMRLAVAEAPAPAQASSALGDRLAGLTRILPSGDVAEETLRLLEAAAAACPKGALPALRMSETAGRKVASGTFLCPIGNQGAGVIVIGYARSDGRIAVAALASQERQATQGGLDTQRDKFVAAIAKLND